MKYLQEIGVLALVVIAATSVYKIVHKQYHHKHHEVEIQATDDGGNAGLIGNGTSLKTNHNHHQVIIQDNEQDPTSYENPLPELQGRLPGSR